jgi:hypothetical protein
MVVEGHRPNDVIVLQMPGKPERKVSVVKSARQPDGMVHTEVKDPATGETFTLIDDGGKAAGHPPADKTPERTPAVTPASGSKGNSKPSENAAAADAPRRGWFGFGSREPQPAAPATAREQPPAPQPQMQSDKPPTRPGLIGRLFGRNRPTPPPAEAPAATASKPETVRPPAGSRLPSPLAPTPGPALVPERMPAPATAAPQLSPSTKSFEPPYAPPLVPPRTPAAEVTPVPAGPLPTPTPAPARVVPTPAPVPVAPPTPVIPVPVVPNPAPSPFPVPQPGLPVTPPGGVSIPAPLPSIPAPLPSVPAPLPVPSVPGLPSIPPVPGAQSAAPNYDPAVTPVAFVTPQIRMADEMHGFVSALQSSPSEAERAMAVKALAEGRYGSRMEVKALLFQAAKADPCPGVRARCIAHLCKLGFFDATFFGYLQSCLADGTPKEVRTAAADALVKMSPR